MLNKIDAEANFRRGLVYANQKKYEEAIEDYSKAIELDPEYWVLYYRRGVAHEMQGKHELAKKDFQKYEKLTGENSKMLKMKESCVYFKKGIACANGRHYNKAILWFRKAIELDLYFSEAYSNIGWIYAHQGKYDDAIGAYYESIEIFPTATAYYEKGMAYMKIEHFSEAIDEFDEAIELNPRYAEAYYERGRAYLEWGFYANSWEKHQKDYDMAVKLNPKYVAERVYERGVDYLQRECWNIAVDVFDEAIELNSKNHIYYRDKAVAQAMNGLYGQASETLKMGYKVEKANWFKK